MNEKMKQYLPKILTALLVGLVLFLGYTTYQLTRERNQLAADLESLERKYKVVQRKYAEQKAQTSALQRTKLALEGKVREARQAAEAAETVKAELEQRLEGLDAEFQRKTAKLKERIDRYVETLEKLKENRDQYKAKLAETVVIVKERNKMIHQLTAEKDDLTASLQETTSGLKRCEKHNARFSKLAEELIVAYENKGLGASIVQAEPFTQLKKVEVEKMIEAYRDRIDDNDLDLIKSSN